MNCIEPAQRVPFGELSCPASDRVRQLNGNERTHIPIQVYDRPAQAGDRKAPFSVTASERGPCLRVGPPR